MNTTPDDCTWSPTVSAAAFPWLKIAKVEYSGQGSGSGTVSFTVGENFSTAARTGTITAGSATYTVKQTVLAKPYRRHSFATKYTERDIMLRAPP
jgi:Putative binding domain, N-terminal